MVTTLLLIIIYITFISLGLPDAIFGVAWPVMRTEFNVSLDTAGLISIITTVSTILSSILSGYLIDKFGTGKITLFSVGLTAFALLGISAIPSFWWILLLAFPLGFGAGSIDTALNNYVAIHFKAHHMNWLHAFWGIGATLGPAIMATVIAWGNSWRMGYKSLSFIQIIFFILILLSLPLWNKHSKIKTQEKTKEEKANLSFKSLIKIKGVKLSLMTFIIYCAIEFSIGLWGASYLVSVRTLSVTLAASFVASYYLGITLGRIGSGFVSFRINNRRLILYGIILFFISSFLLILPIPNTLLVIPFFLQGLGLAPIFPAMTHETPVRFGEDKSQYIIGYQMASAYLGASIFPALFGVIARYWTLAIYPYFLIIFVIVMFYITETLHKRTSK